MNPAVLRLCARSRWRCSSGPDQRVDAGEIDPPGAEPVLVVQLHLHQRHAARPSAGQNVHSQGDDKPSTCQQIDTVEPLKRDGMK
jgi:hypothetical protein